MANDRFLKIGSDGQASEYKTGLKSGEVLAAGDVVRFSTDGRLVKAKASEIAMCKNVAGIVAEAVSAADLDVFLYTDGEVVPENIDLAANKVYFLSKDTAGALMDTVAPEGNVILRLGYTDAAKRFFVKISDPIIRNGGDAPDPVEVPYWENPGSLTLSGISGQSTANLAIVFAPVTPPPLATDGASVRVDFGTHGSFTGIYNRTLSNGSVWGVYINMGTSGNRDAALAAASANSNQFKAYLL